MDEQIINAQAPEAVETPVAPAAAKTLTKPAKAPKALIAIAFITLILAVILDFIPSLTVIFDEPDLDEFMYTLTSISAYCIKALLRGLLLPVALLLVAGNTNKGKAGKVFLGVSILFLLAQLLSAVIMGISALDRLLDIGMFSGDFRSFLSTAFGWVNGNDLLAQPAYFLFSDLENFFDYGLDLDVLIDITYTFCYGTSALLYVLSNAFCAIGFAKLAFSKKK